LTNTDYVYKVKNPLFSVSPANANLQKDNQASVTFPHIISMPNVELPVTSQMEIPTATTTMMEQMTTVNQTATTTVVDQMAAVMAVGRMVPMTVPVVDQPLAAPGTAMDPAATSTMNQIATTTGQISNPASPSYPDTTTGETTTISRNFYKI
jgi:hypothetical protein